MHHVLTRSAKMLVVVITLFALYSINAESKFIERSSTQVQFERWIQSWESTSAPVDTTIQITLPNNAGSIKLDPVKNSTKERTRMCQLAEAANLFSLTDSPTDQDSIRVDILGSEKTFTGFIPLHLVSERISVKNFMQLARVYGDVQPSTDTSESQHPKRKES